MVYAHGGVRGGQYLKLMVFIARIKDERLGVGPCQSLVGDNVGTDISAYAMVAVVLHKHSV